MPVFPDQSSHQSATIELTAAYELLPEPEAEADYQTRRHLLSAFALLSTGRELTDSARVPQAINCYDDTLQKTLSLSQQLDLLELRAGYPMRRHAWAHELQKPEGDVDRWLPFLRQMHTLQAQTDRDFDLEKGTIEIASRFLMGTDENGNRGLTYQQVRSDRIFNLGYGMKDEDNSPQEQANITGFPLSWGFFALGEWIGFKDELAQKWFVSSGGYATELDTITNLGSAWDHNKYLIGVEYKARPLATAS